jgi:hypothetical protein
LYNRLIFAHIRSIKWYYTRVTLVFLHQVSYKARIILNYHIYVLFARHLNRSLLKLVVYRALKVTYIYLYHLLLLLRSRVLEILHLDLIR